MKLIQDFGVRALLGVLIVAPAIGSLVYMSVLGSEAALGALIAMGATVTGYYFGQKA